jgi:transposase
MDASWNQFRQFLTYKAAEAGRKLGLVSPAYTAHNVDIGLNGLGVIPRSLRL